MQWAVGIKNTKIKLTCAWRPKCPSDSLGLVGRRLLACSVKQLTLYLSEKNLNPQRNMQSNLIRKAKNNKISFRTLRWFLSVKCCIYNDHKFENHPHSLFSHKVVRKWNVNLCKMKRLQIEINRRSLFCCQRNIPVYVLLIRQTNAYLSVKARTGLLGFTGVGDETKADCDKINLKAATWDKWGAKTESAKKF